MMERSSLHRLHRFCLVVAVLSAPSVTAWHGSLSHPILKRTATTLLTMTAMRRKAPSRNNNILEDGYGHINRELAETLWNWEQQHRETAKLPKISFSTRQGLRLVDSIVTEIIQSPRGQKYLKGGSDDIQTDLVQEGVMALMDALNEYRQSSARSDDATDTTTDSSDSDKDPNERFEAYARPYLEQRLSSFLDRIERPVELTESETSVWKQIQRVRPQLQSELGGRAPTTQELAARLELPTETLESLLAARRASLSMESTVEIKTPDSLEDSSTHFTDQDQWETREGHLLDTGDGVLKQEVLVDEYQDEMYQYEGEDEMWIHQEQIAAPLRDIIPDGGPSPDDMALSDMLRHDVGEFLTKTLTPEENQVVRMSFGLETGKQGGWEAIAQAMDISAEEVRELLKGALEKLRTTYENNYVETYLEDEQDFFGEDTV